MSIKKLFKVRHWGICHDWPPSNRSHQFVESLVAMSFLREWEIYAQLDGDDEDEARRMSELQTKLRDYDSA